MSYVVVAFSRRTKIPLSLTKLMTSGDIWSHCGIVVPGEDGRNEYIIEALMGKGVVKTPIKEWVKRYPAYRFVKIECPDPAAAHRFARKQVGKKYDYMGMIGAPWRSKWDHPHRWYCSELVEACLKAGKRNRWRGGKVGVRPMETWLNR